MPIESHLDQSRIPNTLFTNTFVVSKGASVGFEAAVFDHYQAMVQTFCRRLRGESPEVTVESVKPEDSVGGCTHSFDLWQGHPLAEEVLTTLAKYRQRMSALRAKVEVHNAEVGCWLPAVAASPTQSPPLAANRTS